MTLRTRPFGRTGWNIADIGFGAWAIGGSWGDVDEAHALANAAASELAALSPGTMQAIRSIYEQQIARHVHHRW